MSNRNFVEKLLTVCLMILSITIYPAASYAFFCPTNFSQIDYGNTIDQVTSICGKPNKEDTVEVKPEVPQEWSYFVPQTVSMGTSNSLTPAQGTLKTQITFDADGKAINISVNGIGVGSTTICGNTIQLGDTRDKIKSTCGKPSFINKQQPDSTNTAKSTKVTTLIYNTTPPVKLIFKDGLLTERQ